MRKLLPVVLAIIACLTPYSPDAAGISHHEQRVKRAGRTLRPMSVVAAGFFSRKHRSPTVFRRG
jgi:hypothetical protein